MFKGANRKSKRQPEKRMKKGQRKRQSKNNYMQLKLLQDISQFGYVTIVAQMIVVISMLILNFNEHKDAWKLMGRQNKHHSVIN